MNHLSSAVSLMFLLSLLALGLMNGNARSETQPLWREGATGEADPELERLGRAFTRLAEKVQPAAVQIRAVRNSTGRERGADTPGNSRGSGFIIHPEGYILTAHHVTDGAQDVEVVLYDRRRLRAQVVASEPEVDVTLLKIDGRDLPTLALGESSNIKIGELVFSLSYPFGRESSLSLGIVSRRGRGEKVQTAFDFIQTDAGASPGSSGGPLVNLRGDVVGMMTMASQSGRMGFAVPISVIKKILPRLARGEKIVWGWLGVRVSELTLEQADALGLSPARGVLVNSVLPDQPAAKSNILPQDVILAINGVEVDSPRELTRIVGGTEAGSKMNLTVYRKGKLLHQPVIVAPRPKEPAEREG
ncbi:MAG: trypsin-like peptidase domain-containing protein [Deltaproteobacteria bacterium]|nr:trypsin-like peptidase domain-containing protein [Deltaproteobacteria bacterium]